MLCIKLSLIIDMHMFALLISGLKHCFPYKFNHNFLVISKILERRFFTILLLHSFEIFYFYFIIVGMFCRIVYFDCLFATINVNIEISCFIFTDSCVATLQTQSVTRSTIPAGLFLPLFNLK